MAKKKKLFSGRGYNPRGSTKRAAKKLAAGIFDIQNVEQMSLEDARDLKAYLKSRQKTIVEEGDSYSADIAREYNLKSKKLTDNPLELLAAFDEQEMYFEEAEYDSDFEEYSSSDEELKELMTDSDKWNIIRRMASVDPRLNLDRAYASETLREIEDMIEQYKYTMSYQELADIMIENILSAREENRYEETMNNLRPFRDSEEIALASNLGFHGVEKAMAKQRRTRGFVFNPNAVAPVWDDPTKFMDADLERHLLGEVII